MFSKLIDTISFDLLGANLPLAFSVFKNKAEYVLDILMLHKKGFINYELANGLKIKTRANSQDKIMVLETNGKKVYTKHFDIKADDIVFDIGAHIGSFSLLAAKLAKNGTIYSFEPEKGNFDLLEKNIEINHLKNTKPFNIAVKSKAGESILNFSYGNTGGHSVVLKGKDRRKQETVKSDSLENIIKNNKLSKIDFIKMDVEGSEYQILYSLPDAVFKKIGKIALEFHIIDEERNDNRLKKFLETKGYDVIIEKIFGARTGMIYAVKNNQSLIN